jgi:hypothetical protein
MVKGGYIMLSFGYYNKKISVQLELLKVITFGQRETDNTNRMYNQMATISDYAKCFTNTVLVN